MFMKIPIADRASVDNDRMVEQRAVAVACGRYLLQEVSQYLGVKSIDLDYLSDLHCIVLMMRQGMEGVGETEFVVYAGVLFPADHERDHTCHVALIGEDLKIRHQFAVLREFSGHA